MKNTLKRYTWEIAIAIFFISLILFINSSHNTELAKKDIEKQNAMSDAQDLINYAEADAAKKTKIEIIQEQIEDNKYDNKLYWKAAEKAKKISEASIWYWRCLEAEWQLELKWEEYNLECHKYYIKSTWLISETYYKDLQKFDTFNLENTKIELGL